MNNIRPLIELYFFHCSLSEKESHVRTHLFILLVQVAVLRGEGGGPGGQAGGLPQYSEGEGGGPSGRYQYWGSFPWNYIKLKQNLVGFLCFLTVLTKSAKFIIHMFQNYGKVHFSLTKTSNAAKPLRARRCLASGKWLDKVGETLLNQLQNVS